MKVKSIRIKEVADIHRKLHDEKGVYSTQDTFCELEKTGKQKRILETVNSSRGGKSKGTFVPCGDYASDEKFNRVPAHFKNNLDISCIVFATLLSLKSFQSIFELAHAT